MKKSAAPWICLALVLTLPLLIQWNAKALLAWQDSGAGWVTIGYLHHLPYAALLLSALWAARIANTPVYVLSLALIPAHYYFSGGPAPIGSGDQMRLVLFLVLPLLAALSMAVSHRTVPASLKTGMMALALGFFLPPLLAVSFGPTVSSWVAAHRWQGAGFLGAPAGPTIYYLAVFALMLLAPFSGREGEMKKILAALVPCYYFSGVFRPVFQTGPLLPPGLEPLTFAVFTSAAALLAIYANFFLTWSKAYVDDLTQVYSRRALNETLGALRGDYAIAMVDVDHFKQFNDTYGHAAGDIVLREVAALLSEGSGGRVYRYGGEEFSVIFPGAAADDAAAQMEEVRRRLADMPISLNGAAKNKRDKKVTVTVSSGVSAASPSAAPEEVLRTADQALYRAKENGRNRVEKA